MLSLPRSPRFPMASAFCTYMHGGRNLSCFPFYACCNAIGRGNQGRGGYCSEPFGRGFAPLRASSHAYCPSRERARSLVEHLINGFRLIASPSSSSHGALPNTQSVRDTERPAPSEWST